MLHNILKIVRGVLTLAAVASAAMMMSATPGHAVEEGMDGCATIEATDFETGETIECAYCSTEIEDFCIGLCDNGDLISFWGCDDFDE